MNSLHCGTGTMFSGHLPLVPGAHLHSFGESSSKHENKYQHSYFTNIRYNTLSVLTILTLRFYSDGKSKKQNQYDLKAVALHCSE